MYFDMSVNNHLREWMSYKNKKPLCDSSSEKPRIKKVIFYCWKLFRSTYTNTRIIDFPFMAFMVALADALETTRDNKPYTKVTIHTHTWKQNDILY